MKKIKIELLLAFILVAVISLGVMSAGSFYFINQVKSEILNKSKAQLLDDYDQRIKNLVENNIGILEYYNEEYKKGNLSLSEAKEKAKETIRDIRYGKDDIGYFWIDNEDYELQLLPPSPEGEGEYRGDLVDQNDTEIIKELVNGAVDNGSTYLDYYFPKPGEEKASRKRGYTQYFEPWGWVIGTGNYVDNIDKVVANMSSELERSINKAIRYLSILFIFIIAGVVLISLWYSNKLSKGIIRIKNSIGKIAKNDLTGDTLEVKNQNEIGELTKFYNEMKKHLNDFVSHIQNDSVKLEKSMNDVKNITVDNKTASEEISKAVQEVTQATVDQAQTTEEAVKNIDNLANDIENLFESSKKLSDRISGINTLNKKGMEKIKTLDKWSDKTLKSSLEVSDSIGNMDESTKMIQGVTQTINEIAEQTNLLALNASIEAARAGEAGKGFAVVADEIRNLAEETASSTEEIDNKVVTIVKATSNAVDSMKETEDIVRKTNKAVNETEEIFIDITKTIDNIVEVIDNIFQFVEGMEEKKEIILDQTNNISSASEQISASSEQVSASTENQLSNMENLLDNIDDLKDMSDNLKNKISEFKVK